MMLWLAALVAPLATSQAVDEAARALSAGRPQQAREMIAVAVKNGSSGPQVDRLLADLSFSERDWTSALARYKALLDTAPNDSMLLRQAGIAALRAGTLTEAVPLLDRAVTAPAADWRAWTARGVAADWQGDWATADRAYERAGELAPGNAQVLNNHGWSLLLRGEWAAAVEPLSQAAAIDPSDQRIAANLDLARSATSASLPERRAGDSKEFYAARLNDAGVVAARRGDRQKAVAAFSQALETSDGWFIRAANNLTLVDTLR